MYHDDPSIGDEADLFRRVHPTQIIPDHTRRCMRISSAAFNDRSMSVDLADALQATGRGPETTLVGHPGHSLVSITARLARSQAQVIARDPLPDNEAHAVVFGRKPPTIRRRLAEGSRWIIPRSPPSYR